MQGHRGRVIGSVLLLLVAVLCTALETQTKTSTDSESRVSMDAMLGDLSVDDYESPLSLSDVDEDADADEVVKEYGDPADAANGDDDGDDDSDGDSDSNGSRDGKSNDGAEKKEKSHPGGSARRHGAMKTKAGDSLLINGDNKKHKKNGGTNGDDDDAKAYFSKIVSGLDANEGNDEGNDDDEDGVLSLLQTDEREGVKETTNSDLKSLMKMKSFRSWWRRLLRRRRHKTMKIWLDDVRCRGNEFRIDHCRRRSWGWNNCKHREDIGVCCRDSKGKCVKEASNGEVEGGLRISKANSNGGRLEIFHRGKWGTICNDHFSTTNARVACRQLGLSYSGGSRFTYGGDGRPGPRARTRPAGAVPIVMDDINCAGTESSLTDCGHRSSSNCNHGQDVALCCRDVMSLKCFSGQVSNGRREGSLRLSGMGAWGGRLEVYNNGVWGTVCSDGFNNNAAEVACRQLGLEHALASFTKYRTPGFHLAGPKGGTGNIEARHRKAELRRMKTFFGRFCTKYCDVAQGRDGKKALMEVLLETNESIGHILKLEPGVISINDDVDSVVEPAMPSVGDSERGDTNSASRTTGYVPTAQVSIRMFLVSLLKANEDTLRGLGRQFCSCPNEQTDVSKSSMKSVDRPQETALGAGQVKNMRLNGHPSLRIDEGTVWPTHFKDLANPQKEGIRELSANVRFRTAFHGMPRVVAAVKGFDLFPGGSRRVLVDVSSVSAVGFTVKMRTWGSTLVKGLGVQWTATGIDEPQRSHYYKDLKHGKTLAKQIKEINSWRQKLPIRVDTMFATMKEREKVHDPAFRQRADYMQKLAASVKKEGDSIRASVKPADLERVLHSIARLKVVLEKVGSEISRTAEARSPLIENMKVWVKNKGKPKFHKLIGWARGETNQLSQWESKRVLEVEAEITELKKFHEKHIRHKLRMLTARMEELREKYTDLMAYKKHGGILCKCDDRSGASPAFPNDNPQSVEQRKVCVCKGDPNNKGSLHNALEAVRKAKADTNKMNIQTGPNGNVRSLRRPASQ